MAGETSKDKKKFKTLEGVDSVTVVRKGSKWDEPDKYGPSSNAQVYKTSMKINKETKAASKAQAKRWDRDSHQWALDRAAKARADDVKSGKGAKGDAKFFPVKTTTKK